MGKAKFNLRLEESFIKEIKKLALDLNIPVNELIERAIKAYAGWEDLNN